MGPDSPGRTTAAEVQSHIESFLSSQLGGERGSIRLAPDTDLFEEGYLDSLGFVELLGFLERAYGVEITEEDMLSPDIVRVEGIARIVERGGSSGAISRA